MVKYTGNPEQYKEGYRFVLIEQYGKEVVLKENTGAPWGHGVYELKPDGKLGTCVDWNFDSSG
jgi:hypothetical protein